MARNKILFACLIALTGSFVSTRLFAQADVIEKRQKLMKGQSAAAKAIKGAVAAKDYATVELKAKDLVESSANIPDYFPKGSTQGKTKAKAEIWSKWNEFNAKAKALGKAARDLGDAAKAGDETGITANVKAVSGACSGCHTAFRAEKYSE